MLDVAASLLVLTALLAVFNRRVLRLPPTIGLMAMSLGLSLALVGLDALGIGGALHEREAELLQSIDFSQLLMQGMLSLLLFAGALHVDVAAMREFRWQVAVLAFTATAASTGAVGLATWWMLQAVGLPMPLLYCLLFGALISPTDPIAVLGMLKSARAPKQLEVVIAGESLFNDGVGVVLFVLVLDMAGGGTLPGAGQVLGMLLRQAGGGLVFGWLLGHATLWLLRRVGHPPVEVMVTLAAVIGGYAFANHLGVSGPLAMVVAGLMVGGVRAGSTLSAASRRHLDLFWELVDDLLNGVLFVLVGMQVIMIRFPGGPGLAAMACVSAIVIALAARWLTVGLPVQAFPMLFRLPRGAAAVLTWGGLRGGISIALALSLPAGAQREAIISLTYAVVAFSILVQGLTFGRLVRASLPAIPPVTSG